MHACIKANKMVSPQREVFSQMHSNEKDLRAEHSLLLLDLLDMTKHAINSLTTGVAAMWLLCVMTLQSRRLCVFVCYWLSAGSRGTFFLGVLLLNLSRKFQNFLSLWATKK